MVAVAILAAGRGTRMKSQLPKVLHPLGSTTLVERALNSCSTVAPSRELVIVGYGADQVQTALAHRPKVKFVTQTEQLGTGHAIQQLLAPLADFDGDILVLNGDVPLLRPETIANLLKTHQDNQNAATLLTAQLPDATGYGRVFCNDQNYVQEIVEHRDCSAEQRLNRRINAGVYCFNWPQLAEVLPKLSNDNDQQEYYITDVFAMMQPVMAVDVADVQEISGINNRVQLAAAETIWQERVRAHWLTAGVTLVNPESITIDDTVEIASDVVIEPQTHLRGNTKIGTGSRIGPSSLIEDSQIGEHVTVMYSVITDSVVQSHSRVGPYAHLRNQAEVGEHCRVGNFVEIKQSQLGTKVNAAHLSYLGNATLGDRVNIGAGTITANYDGVKKHPTVIGEGTKTGSNSVLVAPLTLGVDVTVAAGSVVTKDVEDDTLVIARSRQITRKGWRLKE